METKQIKMTVQQAKELYKLNPEYRTNLLSEFDDEQLGIDDRPKSWEDLKQIKGCYSNEDSVISCMDCYIIAEEHKNIFQSEEYAESALAYSQLSQLVENLNVRRKTAMDWSVNQNKYYIYYDYFLDIASTCHTKVSPLNFISLDDAKFSIEHHSELWKEFLMI